jgi:serine/threonine protein kinase/WD40 repeat protein
MSTSGSESRSGLVMELAEEFLDRYRKGQRPPLREYIERHPELADEIRAVFPAMAMMENIALADESLEGDATGDMPVRRPPLLEQLGDYRIVREVGRGGMGVVYEAEQVSLGRHVALKLLPPQMLRDAKTRRRFEREARAAAKLHHTNIVPVFGVGEQGETPYYVMQFIQGQGLDVVLEELKRLRAGGQDIPPGAALSTVGRDVTAADVALSLLTGRYDAHATDPPGVNGQALAETAAGGSEPALSGSDSGHRSSLSSSSLALPGDQARRRARRQTYWQGVAGIGVQVADALAYAHAQGIVHRDIKPSNLLLDDRGIVWVTDFGLAKTDDQQNLTHTGDILGTLRYMPPEAFGGKVDSRGDVYALGLTLYEMLAFRPAFDEKDRGRLVKQVTGEAPPPVRRLNREVPRDLETIVQKAIEREPSHRYASASELGDDLRRFVDDEPIRARRASYPERLARWGRRNPALAALSGAVGVLMLAVMATLWYGKESARRALIAQTALRAEADERARQAAAAEGHARAEAARADAEAEAARGAAARTEAANRALGAAQEALRGTLYAAHMNLAQVAWDARSPGRTLELLEATRPKPGEPDFRGFEWSYYRRQAHGELAVRKLAGFAGTGRGSRVLSPDGALAGSIRAAEGRQKQPATLIIHETATGGVVREIPVPEVTVLSFQSVSSSSLAFSGDGTRVALVVARTERDPTTGALLDPGEGHALVWSVADGRELLHDTWTSGGTANNIFSLALDRTGARIALAIYGVERSERGLWATSGDLRVLDVADGRERIHLVSGSEAYYSPDLSPDGRLVAARGLSMGGPTIADSVQRLVLLEVDSGRARTEFDDPGLRPTAVCFSPDGCLLAMTTVDRSEAADLVLCDLASGRRLATERLPSAMVSTPLLAFSPDSRLLVLAAPRGPDCQVRELPTGRLLRAPSLGSGGALDLAVRPADGRLFTIDLHGNVREWHPPAFESPSLDSGRVLQRAGGGNLAGRGRVLVALSDPGDSRRPAQFTVHDVSTGQVLRRFERRGDGSVGTIPIRAPFEVGTSGSRFVFAVVRPKDRETVALEVWDHDSGQPVVSVRPDTVGGTLPYANSTYSGMAVDAAGTRLALHTTFTESRADAEVPLSARGVSIVELPSGRLLRRIRCEPSLPTVALSDDGRIVAIATSQVAASGQRHAEVELYEADSGRRVRTLQGSLTSVSRLAFTPDGRRLAAAAYSNLGSAPLEVWDLVADASDAPVHLDGHGQDVIALGFSPDGRRLATTASNSSFSDGELKLWDTQSGRDLVMWGLSGGRPLSLAFDTDGRRLRVLLSQLTTTDARVVLFDATPLAPEVEAVDLVDRLASDVPLNQELAARIEAEPGLDPAERAAACELVPLRRESPAALIRQASSWVRLGASERTPELMRRALAYAERALAIAADLDSAGMITLGIARYRNGKHAGSVESLRRSMALQDEENLPMARREGMPLAYIAMAEAKLGHQAEAQAALDAYRAHRAKLLAGAKTPLPENTLRAEAESVVREAFGAGPAAVGDRRD